MRAPLSVVALLGLLSSAVAGPKEDALAVLETWTKAFAASDVDGIVKLYAPDALFLGTASKTAVVKPEGIRSYFENALLNNRPGGATLKDYAATVAEHPTGPHPLAARETAPFEGKSSSCGSVDPARSGRVVLGPSVGR
jgi:Domain of unknown function (DUF4440)